MNNFARIIAVLIIAVCISCSSEKDSSQNQQMDVIAEKYVKLVLNMGLYDTDYVDAYFGPEDWRPSESEKQDSFPYDDFSEQTQQLFDLCESIEQNKLVDLEKQRYTYLIKQLKSVQAKKFYDLSCQLLTNDAKRGRLDCRKEMTVTSTVIFVKAITRVRQSLPYPKFRSDSVAPENPTFFIPVCSYPF